MNLAGNQAKNLFKSIRTGSRPQVVGLWAAATVVDQIRQRRRPKRELLLRKKLKPGESYVIRVPGKGEGPLAEALPAETVVAEIGGEESIGSELLSAATGLLSAAAQPEPKEAVMKEPRRRRRREPAGEVPEKRPRRRDRRKETGEAQPAEPAAGASVMSTLADVAASFTEANTEDAAAEESIPSRRARRHQARLATLEEAELDREALPRRRRRKLRRAERRAQKRPSRRRTRKARRQQRKARAALNRVAKKQTKVRRRERRVGAAEDDVAKWRAKVEQRSTRRRRRKLRKAERRLSKHLR